MINSKLKSNICLKKLTCPRTGISQRDSFVTVLKKYGLFSRLHQNLLHPDFRSSRGKSGTGSLGFGDITTPWALWDGELFTYDTLGISDETESVLSTTGAEIPE